MGDFNIAVIQLRTVHVDDDRRVSVEIGLDLDGEIHRILEPEVAGPPCHGGVDAQRKIAYKEHVIGTFHNLKIRVDGTAVKGGGDLADATAQIRDGFSAYIGDSHAVAFSFGALAQRIVVGERFSRIQYDAVDGLRSQTDVGDAVTGTAAERGLTVVETVTEQQIIKHIFCDGRFRINDIKGQRLSRSRRPIGGFRRGKIETHTGHGFRQAAGGFVIDGGNGLHIDGFIQRVQIHRGRPLRRHFERPGFTSLDGGLQSVCKGLYHFFSIHRFQSGTLHQRNAVIGRNAGLCIRQTVVCVGSFGDPLTQDGVVIAGIDVVHQIQRARPGVIRDGVFYGVSATPVSHGLGSQSFGT